MINKLWEDYLNYVDYVEYGFGIVAKIIVVIIRGTSTVVLLIVGAPFALVGWLYEKLCRDEE